MSIDHARLCVCLCVPRRIPTILYAPWCNFGEWQGVPLSCALLGGFAIGVRVCCYGNIRASCEMTATMLVFVVWLIKTVNSQTADVVYLGLPLADGLKFVIRMSQNVQDRGRQIYWITADNFAAKYRHNISEKLQYLSTEVRFSASPCIMRFERHRVANAVPLLTYLK